MHALNNSLIHYLHLYQENIEANGIFKNKIEGKLRKMPRNLSEQNLFGFHWFIMSCDDLSANNAQVMGTLYILLLAFIGYVNKQQNIKIYMYSLESDEIWQNSC